MATRSTPNNHPQRVSRREGLRLFGSASAAVLLAACGGGAAPTVALPTGASGAPSVPPAVTPSAVAPSAVATSAPAGMIQIPDTGAKLPTEKATLRWVDSGDRKATFFKAFFPAYQKAHPNVTVQYDALPWNEIGKVVPLGVQNGNAPDVFQLPPNFTGGQAVGEGWVMALDDIIPNFARWKAAFPPGSFFNGITDFGGKTYTFPLFSQKVDNLLLYNTEYMRGAGYDPQAKALTWDDFRAVAKKMAQQGGGKYYGLVFGGSQSGVWNSFVTGLAEMAGAPGGEFDWKTGQYTYTTDPYLAAIDLLLAMKSDGSVFPGSVNINASQARAQLPQGGRG